MILPEGHENLTDEELVAALVSEELYTDIEARAVVAMLRHGDDDEVAASR